MTIQNVGDDLLRCDWYEGITEFFLNLCYLHHLSQNAIVDYKTCFSTLMHWKLGVAWNKAEAETKRQMESVKTGLVLIKNLEVELNLYKEAAVKQDRALLSIEKQSQKYGAEAAAYATKLTHVSSVLCATVFWFAFKLRSVTTNI